MVYGTYNELVTGANLNQLITGGPHIVYHGIYGIPWYIWYTMVYMVIC